MNYGFAINNNTCIGCHACSTACKSENEVPLGVNRTWVKYVESGVYPNTRRSFQVTRCNHCANPPCVRICPVTAMYQRGDGIVEFDPDICIGCKACMQACPYDAIYIDPNHRTAAKCHFCAHRLDIGLEPACVVVCPTHSIIAGDIDDPQSEVSRVLAANQVTVRKPEQGTAPKLFYINGSDVAMHPTATERTPTSFLWADVMPLHEGHGGGHSNGGAAPAGGKTAKSGVAIRTPQTQGTAVAGPIQLGAGRMAEQMVQVAYNAQHKIPWHWQVPAYLTTKGVGSGVFMLLGLALGLGMLPADNVMISLVGGFLSLLFTGLTTAFLVADLDRPERFLSIVFRPQWKSWLARGAYILISFSAVTGLWWLFQLAGYLNWLPPETLASLTPVAGVLVWVGVVLAVGVAIYTAFLFGQAEGRDLWQSPLLPFHLLVQALMAGSGTLLAMMLFMPPPPAGMPDAFSGVLLAVFAASLAVDVFVTLIGEFGMPHASEVAASAAHDISHGRYKGKFWWGSIVLGHLVPGALLFVPSPITAAIAGLCAIIGLYLFEYAFVMAPQDVPNS